MSLFAHFGQLFLNRFCLLCELPVQRKQWICRNCEPSLPKNKQACPICAMPVYQNGICGRCLSNPPHFDNSLVPFTFKPPINNLIHQFKYNHQFYACRPLIAELLKSINRSSQALPDVILPIPLHNRRLFKRGFNQSSIIAQTLSRELTLPCKTRILIRLKNTKPQVQLNAKQREKEIKNAFHLRKTCRFEHVALVDDVMTTSQTVNEAAKTLKISGIKKISVWALARNTDSTNT